MADTAYCITCQALVPIARQAVGKAIGATLASALGGAATKSVLGAVTIGAVGLLVGHLVDEGLDAVCGQCGGQVVLAPVKL